MLTSTITSLLCGATLILGIEFTTPQPGDVWPRVSNQSIEWDDAQGSAAFGSLVLQQLNGEGYSTRLGNKIELSRKPSYNIDYPFIVPDGDYTLRLVDINDNSVVLTEVSPLSINVNATIDAPDHAANTSTSEAAGNTSAIPAKNSTSAPQMNSTAAAPAPTAPSAKQKSPASSQFKVRDSFVLGLALCIISIFSL